MSIITKNPLTLHHFTTKVAPKQKKCYFFLHYEKKFL